MLFGVPVVSTGYGGVLDFLDDSCGFLVPYRPVEVSESTSAYPRGATWADPDVEQAAIALRTIASDRERAERIGQLGELRIKSLIKDADIPLILRQRLST